MPFSQQTYTGQGIVQPTERSRVGEFLGAGLAGLGAGIGEGIKKFQQNKEEAKELRSSLPGLAKFMPKEERDEFLEQVAVSDLSGLRGLRRRVLEFGEQQLQQERLEEARARREAVQQQAEQTRQRGNVFQALLQTQIPQEVSVPRTDYTPDIEAARREEQRLQSMMKFAPQPEGAMATGESLRSIAARGGMPAGGFDTQFIQEQLAAGVQPSGQAATQTQVGQGPTGYQQSMAGIARRGLEAMGQIEETISKPIEDIRSQISELEAKQQAELSKPEKRPETAQEMSQRRTETIRQVIADNPLAAETIYTALMGKTVEPPKLDAESRKTIGFADRMNNAERGLASVLEDFNPAGTFQGLAAAMPNLMKSQDRRQYEALALDWITANLRQESGAAIGEKEYENDFKKYFPQPGDSEETVKLKQSLREQAVASKVGPIQSMFPNVNIMGMAGQSSPTTSRMSFNPSTKTIQ